MLVGTPGVYSLISDIPWLKHDFHDIKHWGIAFTVLFSTGTKRELCSFE